MCLRKGLMLHVPQLQMDLVFGSRFRSETCFILTPDEPRNITWFFPSRLDDPLDLEEPFQPPHLKYAFPNQDS